MKAIDQPRPTLYTCTPTLITKFIVVLHNITIEEEGLSFDDMGEDIPDLDTPLLQGMGGGGDVQRANKGTNIRIKIRNKFVSFLNNLQS